MPEREQMYLVASEPTTLVDTGEPVDGAEYILNEDYDSYTITTLDAQIEHIPRTVAVKFALAILENERKTAQLDVDDMRVANMNHDGFGDTNDPDSDWRVINDHATFAHADACEFIVHVGCKDDNDLGYHKSIMDNWSGWGLSNKGLELLEKAYQAGFTYLCLYA